MAVEIGIETPCPHCGEENEVELADIKKDPRYTCWSCGKQVEYDDPGTIAFLENFENMEDWDIYRPLKDGEEPQSDEEFRDDLRKHTRLALEDVFGKENVKETEPGQIEIDTAAPRIERKDDENK